MNKKPLFENIGGNTFKMTYPQPMGMMKEDDRYMQSKATNERAEEIAKKVWPGQDVYLTKSAFKNDTALFIFNFMENVVGPPPYKRFLMLHVPTQKWFSAEGEPKDWNPVDEGAL